MFMSLNRISVLKLITSDRLIFSPRHTTWTQIYRWSSGLMEKEQERIELPYEMNFSNFLQQRQEQSKRSFLAKVNSVEDYSKSEVAIGDVRKSVKPPKKPQYVPHKYLSMGQLSQNSLRHLRWMLQKDLLKQDIFLIGRPGPTRRQLAMVFLEMTSREVEYVSLSRDTTEADLKQRREILGGTAKYFDQNAVRAAVEGRVLILEGIEKAERNVLPVLNNLLENREMHLEDGRFLIPASRYDKLLKEHSKEELDKWNLVRVSDEFRVIALGLPVPKYSGNPLDPPLRSRFQARNVLPSSFQEQLSELQELAPNTDIKKINQLLSCAYALTTEESNSLGLPDFPVDNIPKLGQILNQFPNTETSELLNRLYPYQSFLNREGQESVNHILKTFQVQRKKATGNKLEKVNSSTVENRALCSVKYNSSKVEANVPCGSLTSGDTLTKYIPTDFQENLVVDLLQSHVASDFCLIGPKGCGKSATVLRLADMLNYEVEPIVLYQDITSRDLIQQRNTLPNGDTVWQNSPLIQAALEGKMAVLDGIDRVHPSTLSVIHSLVQDREVQLYDGKRLVRHDRYDEIKQKHNMSDEDMVASGIFKIHPSFRIVALAESLKKGVNPTKWLSAEMLSLFLFHEMRPLSFREEKDIIEKLYGTTNEKTEQILNLAVSLRSSNDPTLMSLSPFFSTRQLLRISKRLSNYPLDSVYDTIQKACLARFLPPLTKEALDNAMKTAGIVPDANVENSEITCDVTDKTVKVGNTEVSRYDTDAKTKVPDILFYNVPQHLALLEWLIQDFTLGEHLLLVGNQGVGKNKIADRLLQLLNRPREYIQLHRDTTVQTLTLQPTVTEGVVSYEDSPLVRAVKNGYVLVVDEADKAPTHVTCILKTLVERGEMTLSDGRKIIPFGDARAKKPNMVEVHPDFRMIVLANRPGFPFLGNDFFGALGDLFSCHAVDNPSPESEIALLKQYGPDVADDVILKLVRAFGELRTMADKGMVQYPYSTREVVNIVKHLQNFPGELLANALSNVFDFDQHSSTTLETLMAVLQKNGIPINNSRENVSLAREYPLPSMKKFGSWYINRTSTDYNTSVASKNIEIGPKQNLSCSKSDLDVTEVRGSVFSELYSYTSLPMPIGNAVVGLTVVQDQTSANDFINVLTINPFRLYVASSLNRDVRILSLDSLLPRLEGRKYKFSVTRLTGDFSDTVLIHEENLNHLLLINIFENSAWVLNPAKWSKWGRQNYDKWKFNGQLANENIVILYKWRQKEIEVLNLNSMSAFTLSVPMDIKSLQVLGEGKWLVQSVDDRKFILMNHNPEDVVPTVIRHVEESSDSDMNLGLILHSTQTDLDNETLSAALERKISSPNRLFLTDESYAAITVGFPELELDINEVYVWPRTKDHRGWTGMQGKSVSLENTSQIVTPVSKTLAPKEVRDLHGTALGFLEAVNLKRRSVQYIPVPEGSDQSWYVDSASLGIYLDRTRNDGLVTVDVGGNIRYWETGYLQLQRSLDDWQKMIGTGTLSFDGEGPLRLTIERDSGKDVSKPKHGKVDPDNKPHVGGNTWAGGTGGRDTAGLGGKGGPYRLDAGHDVHQISDYEKSQVPEEVKMAAREMGLKAFRQRLKEIKMSQYDHDMYLSYSVPVANEVKMLKVIIDNAQRKSKEREWVRHQTTGVLDDLKLIEGLTGEKTIFRRRTEIEPEPGAPIMKPKRLKLVADVSGSMLRFNSYDGRLNRMLEASVLVMEAFQDQETKFKYDISGHSGDGYNIPFVEVDKTPKNNKERLEVIKTMYAHSQFCMSGDHTLPATMHAIETIAKEDCDEAIVIILSDANLERYRIRPLKFSQVLTSNPEVNSYAIFIGSLGDQATRLAASLPAGRAFVCMDLSKIPQIMQQIFTASVLSST